MRPWCLTLLLAVCMGARAQQVSLVFAGDTTLDDAPGALIERGGGSIGGFCQLVRAGGPACGQPGMRGGHHRRPG